MNLCNKSQLVILNGRKLGDLEGKFTCHKYNGSSVDDLMISSAELYHKVKYFKVLDPVWYSDHCPILCSMKVNMCESIDPEENTHVKPPPVRFKWNDEGAVQFTNRVNETLLTEARKIQTLNTDINVIAQEYEKAFFRIASDTLSKKNNNSNIKNRTHWMNKECFEESKKT